MAQITKRSGDARLKLLEKNIRLLKKYGELDTAVSALKRTGPNVAGVGTVSAKVQQKRVTPIAAPIKRTIPYQRGGGGGLAGNGNEMDIDMEYYPTAPSTSLRRTVTNDIAYVPSTTKMPPLPTFDKYNDVVRRMTTVKRPMEYEVDPFDCYEVPVARPYDVSEPRNVNRSVLGAHMDAYPHQSSLRGAGNGSNNGMGGMEYERPMQSTSSQYKSGGGSGINSRYIGDENSHLSHEMRVRLQRAPDVTQSAGIFSNPYTSNSRERERQIISGGYRIVVSNLHGSVSQSDIKVNIYRISFESQKAAVVRLFMIYSCVSIGTI